MDQELSEVAQYGDINALYALLSRCPSILDDVDRVRFTNTPLHRAVLAGHTSFVVEIANLMPSFAMKLNPDGLSPLHLASEIGHLEIVVELLKVNNNLCNLKGRERRTPFHHAAMAGHINVLKELLSNCPKCIFDLTLRKETALHLALTNDHIDVFKELVKWLRHHWQHDLLGYQDQEGNTVLHLAVSRGHHEAVEVLLCHSHLIVRKAVQINVKNAEGLTALDLVQMGGGDLERIESILRGVGAKSGNDEIVCRPTILSTIEWFFNSIVKPSLKHLSFRVDPNTPSEQRNALLVVVALIVTATYQTGITPPSGFWQDDHYNKGDDDDITPTHYAGSPIWGTYNPFMYSIVMFLNYAGFIVSVVLVFNLTSGFPLRGPLLVALMLMVITYILSAPIFFTEESSKFEIVYNNLMTWLPFVGVLIFWFVTGNWIKKIWRQVSLLIRSARG